MWLFQCKSCEPLAGLGGYEVGVAGGYTRKSYLWLTGVKLKQRNKINQFVRICSPYVHDNKPIRDQGQGLMSI